MSFTRPNEDLEKWWIARVEPYVDPEGKTNWAVSYGSRYTELVVWYHLEEVKNFFSKWTMPSKSRWTNVDEWNKFAKLEPFKPKIGSRDSRRNRTNGSRGSKCYNRGSQYSGNRGSGRGRGGNKDSYTEYYPHQDWQAEEEGYYYENGGPASHPRRDRERKPSYEDQRRR